MAGAGVDSTIKTLILILLINVALKKVLGFPGSLQCKRSEFNPWIRKMPWRRKWQPTSSILAWRIPWTEEPGGLQFMGSQESDMTEQLNHHHGEELRMEASRQVGRLVSQSLLEPEPGWLL